MAFAIDQLEAAMNKKYDSQASIQNYKGLSKRILQELRSKQDLRKSLFNAKDPLQIEGFLSAFLFDRPKMGAQASENDP